MLSHFSVQLSLKETEEESDLKALLRWRRLSDELKNSEEELQILRCVFPVHLLNWFTIVVATAAETVIFFSLKHVPQIDNTTLINNLPCLNT